MGNVFFVVGHERSGTHWVMNLLNQHPDIVCAGEFHFDILYSSLNKINRMERSPLSQEPYKQKMKAYVDESVKKIIMSQPGDARWYGDVTPRPLKPYFRAPHILIVRDVRAVLVSWTIFAMAKNLADFRHYPLMMENKIKFDKDENYFDYHKDELLVDKQWVKDIVIDWNQRIINDLEVISKVKKGILDLPLFVLKYEQLHSDTIGMRNQIYSFLGLDADQAGPLDEMTRPGYFIGNHSTYRKGKVGNWKEYISKDDQILIGTICQKAMQSFNYS